MAMEYSTSTPVCNLLPDAPIDDCLEVTITVLGCSGVVAKRYDSKNLVWKNRQVTKTTASIVASFSQHISAGNSFLTHMPSMPMEHLDASSITIKPIPQPIVHWPSVGVCSEGGDETQCQALSTLRFTRRFQREPVNDTASSTRRKEVPT
eukprot:scaffold618_cov130-Skeletonema_dohrnii-CCMP3373.AAC.3